MLYKIKQHNLLTSRREKMHHKQCNTYVKRYEGCLVVVSSADTQTIILIYYIEVRHSNG